MAGGDPQTARLPALLPAGTPALHGSSALDTVVLTAGTVVSGQVKPAGAPGARLGELSVQISLALGGGEQVQLVAGLLHLLLLALGKLANKVATLVHLCGTPVGLLTVAVGLALVVELASLHTGTLGWQLGPLQLLAGLQFLVIAVGKGECAHVCRGHL